MKKDNSLPIFEMLGLLETEKPKKVKVKPVPAIKVVETKNPWSHIKRLKHISLFAVKTEKKFLEHQLKLDF